MPDGHRDTVGGRQCAVLLADRLCLRPAALQGAEFLVRAYAWHADAAVSRDAYPAIRAVPQPWLGQHYPSVGRAEVHGDGRLFHLPYGPILPRHPPRARRG